MSTSNVRHIAKHGAVFHTRNKRIVVITHVFDPRERVESNPDLNTVIETVEIYNRNLDGKVLIGKEGRPLEVVPIEDCKYKCIKGFDLLTGTEFLWYVMGTITNIGPHDLDLKERIATVKTGQMEPIERLQDLLLDVNFTEIGQPRKIPTGPREDLSRQSIINVTPGFGQPQEIQKASGAYKHPDTGGMPIDSYENKGGLPHETYHAEVTLPLIMSHPRPVNDHPLLQVDVHGKPLDPLTHAWETLSAEERVKRIDERAAWIEKKAPLTKRSSYLYTNQPAGGVWTAWHGFTEAAPLTVKDDTHLLRVSRNGEQIEGNACGLRWRHTGDEYDIMEFKIISGEKTAGSITVSKLIEDVINEILTMRSELAALRLVVGI